MNITTQCGVRPKHLISFVEITEHSCYYPPPTESGRLSAEKICYNPPPPPNLVGFRR